MRPITIYKPMGGIRGAGYFHRFSESYVEDEYGKFAAYPVAIVETADGQVDIVRVPLIKFEDRPGGMACSTLEELEINDGK